MAAAALPTGRGLHENGFGKGKMIGFCSGAEGEKNKNRRPGEQRKQIRGLREKRATA